MKKLFLAAFLFSTLAATATKKYVRTDGSNANSGTTNTSGGAWLTIVYAASHAVSGDTIMVQPGTYTETAQIVLPVNISLAGTDSTTCIIRSTLTAQFTPMLALVSASEGTNGNQVVYNLKFDGQNLSTSWGISIIARSHVTVHDISAFNFRESGVVFTGITAPTGDGEPTTYATGNQFYNNRVFNCATNVLTLGFKYGRGNVQFGGQDSMLFYNNYINQPYRTGTSTDDIGWPVKYATGGFIRNCKVYNNTLIRAPFTGAGHGVNEDWNFSFEMWNVKNLEMYGNNFTGEVDFANITKGAYAMGLYFHNNYCSYPTRRSYYQSGLRLETNESDILIDSNHFKNMQNAIVFSPKDYQLNGFGIDVHRVTIRRNLMDSLGFVSGAGNYGDQQAIAFQNFDNPVTYVDSINIYNNTIICDPTNSMYIGILVPAYAGGFCKNIRIINNIIQGFTLNPLYLNPSTQVDSLHIKNNNFYGNTTNAMYLSGANPVHYFSSGNITTIPLFVGGGNYTLQAGSLNIDAGTNIGLSFTGGAPDIGYSEYGGADVTPPTISSTNPTNGATGITPGAYSIVINFNEAMNTGTLTSGNITGISGTFTAASTYVTIAATLAASTTYTITIGAGVTDAAGNAIAPTSFSFTTGSIVTPPPTGTIEIRSYLLIRKN